MLEYLPLRMTAHSIVALVMVLSASSSCQAQLTVKARKSLPGKLVALGRESITVETDSGKKSVAYTEPGKLAVALPKAAVNLRHQTTIKVVGHVPADGLVAGQVVQLKAMLTKAGKSNSAVETLALIGKGDDAGTIKPVREPENTRDYVECEIKAEIDSIRRQTLTLVLPKQPFAPTGKLRIKLADHAKLDINESNLDRCVAGDIVKVLKVLELDSGDLVAEQIEIELDRKEADRKPAITGKSTDLFSPKNYLKYSDKPSAPRDVRSNHFLLHTDLSERSARMLLDKLEYMIGLISRYYGRLPDGIIECYVVRDLTQWKDIPMDPSGVAKVQERAGVTISRSLGKQRKSIVYSCDDHGVVQHEAVHAYCAQTFGSTGPTWYSEGMAEMGQYWKKDNLAVEIPPNVIRYLTTAEPKKMKDIVAAGQITGDSWQAYAWRWALCHLLANNSNYSGRFKGLGMNMMNGGKASFETVYGDVANEISFEYDQFVRNFGNGYRVDLCQWDWSTKPMAISGPRRLNCKIDSKGGWQASRLKLNEGKKYEFVCVGEWKASKSGDMLDGDGDADGKGKLIGVVFTDYDIGEVLELGQKGSFVAPRDGHLFLRFREDFTKLSDNEGKMTVHFRRAIE